MKEDVRQRSELEIRAFSCCESSSQCDGFIDGQIRMLLGLKQKKNATTSNQTSASQFLKQKTCGIERDLFFTNCKNDYQKTQRWYCTDLDSSETKLVGILYEIVPIIFIYLFDFSSIIDLLLNKQQLIVRLMWYFYTYLWARQHAQICTSQGRAQGGSMHTYYLLDVLCRQPIKLFQVVSASEFHEY